jgi:hypothetical protein
LGAGGTTDPITLYRPHLVEPTLEWTNVPPGENVAGIWKCSLVLKHELRGRKLVINPRPPEEQSARELVCGVKGRYEAKDVQNRWWPITVLQHE